MVRVTLLVLLCVISITLAYRQHGGVSEYTLSETELLSPHAGLKLNYYDPRVRPQEKTEVQFGISLHQIISYKKDDDTDRWRSFVFQLWHYIKYNDARLAWNETNYSGVKSVRLPLGDVWMPDIKMYNSMHPSSGYEGALAVVSSNGDVSVVPIINEEVMCYRRDDPNIYYCNLKYGSWTYPGNQLNLTSRGDQVDLSTYSGRYSIMSADCQRNVIQYDCCPDPYIDITCSIVINGLRTD